MSDLPVNEKGRVKCCGRQALVYKHSDERSNAPYHFCDRCDHRYSFKGEDLGIHGTGIATKEEYMDSLRHYMGPQWSVLPKRPE